MASRQDVLNQEIAPVEEGVMPSDIVGVNQPGGWHRPVKQVCDGGLPASGTAIHGHNPRSVMTLSISVENQMDNVTDRRYSPWTRRRLPRAKLHVKIPFLVGSLRGQVILSLSDIMPDRSHPNRLLAAMGNLPGGGLQRQA
jgi:hypothetical protein